jgi:hypothetical protein
MNVPKIRDAIGELVLGGAEQRVRPIRSKAGTDHARIGAVGSELLLFQRPERACAAVRWASATLWPGGPGHARRDQPVRIRP